MSDPAYSRAILETDSDPDTLAIRLRATRDWPKLIFLGLWLCGWAIGEVAALLGLFFFVSEPLVATFLVVWLTVWSFGGYAAGTAFLWRLGGYERLTLSAHTVTVTRGMPLRRRVTTCDATAVTNLRAAPIDYEAFRQHQVTPGLKARRDLGTIKFDYGNYTMGFGLGLENDQARDLSALIHRRFPQFAPRP